MRYRLILYVLIISCLFVSGALAQSPVNSYGMMPQTGAFAQTPGGQGYQPGMLRSVTGESGYPAGWSPYLQQPATSPMHVPAPISMPITSNKAIEIISKYLEKTNNDDLFLAKLFEYNAHYEAELKEKETQRGAFELIVDKLNGRVQPEMGPNLVWNTKYGIDGNYFGIQPVLSISVDDARKNVEDFLKRTSPELKTEDEITEYFGYYEFHVNFEGKLAVEVNINGFNGQMWVENWHGSYLRKVKIVND